MDILQFSLEPARFLPLDLIPHQKICFMSEECLYLECILVTCLSLSRDPWDFRVFRNLQSPRICAIKVPLVLDQSKDVHTQSYTSV